MPALADDMGTPGVRAARQRTQRVKWAVASSFSSKVTTALVQLVALPVAARALGVHGFALYATLFAAVGWMSLASLGVGPTLVTRISRSAATDGGSSAQIDFGSALPPVLAAAATLLVCVLCTVWFLPVHLAFGAEFQADSQTIRVALTYLAFLAASGAVVSVYEAAQAGHQEQHTANLVATFGSIPCVLATVLVARLDPSVVGVIVALTLPALACRIGNALLVVRRHPQYVHPLRGFDRRACGAIVGDGLVFSLAGTGANFLAHMWPIVLIGRTQSAQDTAAFAAVMNSLILAAGVLATFAVPTWSAVSDARAHGDLAWARVAYRTLAGAAALYAAAAGLVIVFAGPALFPLWLGKGIQPTQSLLISAAAYFVAISWEVVHFNVLVGLGQVRLPSLLYAARAVVGAVAMWILVPRGGVAAAFWAMTVTTIPLTCVPFWAIVRDRLESTGEQAKTLP